MRVENNIQHQNFGMALKINKGAENALKKLPIETLETLEKAGEKLSSTKHFHVRVDDNLNAKIESGENTPFGLFDIGEYRAKEYGKQIQGDKVVPDQRILMIEEGNNDVIAGVARYENPGFSPNYNVWSMHHPLKTVEDIDTLSKIAKILDNAAEKAYHEQIVKEIEENRKQRIINNAVKNLLTYFGE